jgi:protein O-mannosyl-transferase
MKHLPESAGSKPFEAPPAASVITPLSYWPATQAMRVSGPPIALFLISLAVFAPALLNGFVKWDDDINLLDNPHYRGLGWSHIRWMFANTLTGHYIPVTWLSFGLDYTIWGMNPIGYHLTNVVLHAANAALFYLIAIRLLRRATSLAGTPLILGSAMAALLFAVHPLRVESVAWATERRDVLSGLFFLLTVLTYLLAVEHGTRRRRHLLAVSVGCYALALLSKSIVMTLPLVLVLLDVYPLGRLSLKRGTWWRGATRGVLIEKLPYLALGIAGGVTAYWAVLSNQYLTLLERYGWTARAAMAGYSGWFYLEKTVIPAGLSPLHELPAQVEWLAPRFLYSTIAVVGLTVLLFVLRRRWPGGLATGAYYAIVLGPVSGIVHSGHQLTHDRYSYLSCLGWVLLVGAASGVIARACNAGLVSRWMARTAATVAAVWILTLSALTWMQIQAWRDTESLWRYAVEADPACSLCQANLGDVLYQQNHFGLAKERYELALASRPDRIRAHSGLGLVAAEMGQFDVATSHLRFALERRPNDPDVVTAMAFALLKQGRPADAIPLLQRAIRIEPGYFHGHAQLGAAYMQAGQPDKALTHLERAIALRPQDPGVRLIATGSYLAVNRPDAAGAAYDAFLRLNQHRPLR